MSFFRTKITTDIHDVDFNGVARTSAIMRYIQTSAQLQLTESGLSYERLREQNRAFLLSKIKLEIFGSIRAYETLYAETFPVESRGYSFLRCYRLTDGKNTVAVAASVWALIDTEKHSLVRVNDFELGLPTLPPLDLSIGRIMLPDALTRVGAYHVNYEATDQNGHMNNTRYPDMYSNYLELSGKRIRSITVNYTKEAPMGEKLSVLHGERDGLHYFKTLCADGELNSLAEIELTDI